MCPAWSRAHSCRRLEIINRKGLPRLRMGNILPRIHGQLPGMAYLLRRVILPDLEFLLWVNQVGILDDIPVGLEDERPLEGIPINSRPTRDGPQAIISLNDVAGYLGRGFGGFQGHRFLGRSGLLGNLRALNAFLAAA